MSDIFQIRTLQFAVPGCRDANFLRGGFGRALRSLDRDAYDRLFSPRLIEGPSGLRDAPRPFVLRADEDGFRFHLFDPRESTEKINQAFRTFLTIGQVNCEDIALPLSSDRVASQLRVRFKTPTELKGAERPEFGVLFSRVRDRISTLRALYQGGPLEIDFKAMGERAAMIKMNRCEIQHVAAERTSRATGQTHPLGGFIGVAEYAGELGEFLPYLEIAKWTGIGRQTVWGKGEIDCETF